MMLYRQGLASPLQQPGGTSLDEVTSPGSTAMSEDVDDEVYFKLAEAGRRVLLLYRQLHRIHLVNYTFLATVHLFMAGKSSGP